LKKIIILISAAVFFFTAVFAEEKIIFTEISVNYSSVFDPAGISDDITGVYDGPDFYANAGCDIYGWASVYAGVGFCFYIDMQDSNFNYTFTPVYIGARANIFPENSFYPDIFFEYGRAFANRHTVIYGPLLSEDPVDTPWTADYYSFGIGVNYRLTDIAVVSVKVHRPAFSGSLSGEIHTVKAGASVKIYY